MDKSVPKASRAACATDSKKAAKDDSPAAFRSHSQCRNVLFFGPTDSSVCNAEAGERNLTGEIGARIDRFTGNPHFIMQVRAGRTAGGADIADQIALVHGVAGMDRETGKVAIAGLQFAAMFDLDVVAVAGEPVGTGDEAIGRGVDRVPAGAARSRPLWLRRPPSTGWVRMP